MSQRFMVRSMLRLQLRLPLLSSTIHYIQTRQAMVAVTNILILMLQTAPAQPLVPRTQYRLVKHPIQLTRKCQSAQPILLIQVPLPTELPEPTPNLRHCPRLQAILCKARCSRDTRRTLRFPAAQWTMCRRNRIGEIIAGVEAIFTILRTA
jgi:hypothetical protein